MKGPIIAEIRPAGESDRSLLARFSPGWFRQNLVELGWLAGAGERVEAALMLAAAGRSVLHVEVAAISDAAFDRWSARLVETAAEEARAIGATALEVPVTSLASNRHAERLEAIGFHVHETFDRYEVDTTWLLERVRRFRVRIEGRIASRLEARIEQLDLQHLDTVATAWSAWIGGQVDHGIQRLRSRFHRSGPDSPARRLQLVAVANEAVVGFACGHLESPTTFKIDAEAVDPRHRFDPFFTELTQRFYEIALELGAERTVFEAGRRQPNTSTFARRTNLAPTVSRKHLRIELGDASADATVARSPRA